MPTFANVWNNSWALYPNFSKSGISLRLEAYHDKGDEFLFRSHSIKELRAKLERARTMLRDRPKFVERADGSTIAITGADSAMALERALRKQNSVLGATKPSVKPEER